MHKIQMLTLVFVFCREYSNDIVALLLNEGENLLQLIKDNIESTPYTLANIISNS